MALKKVSYKKIKKGIQNQFYELMQELFPLLLISVISTKGKITLSDKNSISFFRKSNRVSIETLLFTYLPYALAVRNFGNDADNIVTYYRRMAEDLIISKSTGNKIEDTSRIIILFYNECFNRNAEKEEIINEIILETPINTDMDDPEDEDLLEKKGTANFFDYVFNFPKKKERRLRIKKIIIAASLTGFLAMTTPLMENIQKVADNLLLRAPPPQMIIIYNST